MRAASTWGPDGERLVAPLAAQDSSLMADFARADCLIVRAPDAPALARWRAGDDHPAWMIDRARRLIPRQPESLKS